MLVFPPLTFSCPMFIFPLLTFYCLVLSSPPSLVLPHALLGKAAGMEAQIRDPGFEKTLDT